MDLQEIMPWLVFANTFVALSTVLYTLLTTGAKKTATALDSYKKTNNEQVADHNKRIQAVENELKHLPDRAMVHDLQLTLKDIQIELASVKAATEQATRTSQRVETYLLERSKEGGK